VSSALLSVFFVFYSRKRLGEQRTRAVADLLWVAVGGLGALLVFLSSFFISQVEDDLEKARSALTKLQIAESTIQLVNSEYCAVSDDRFPPVFIESCNRILELIRITTEYDFLWALPSETQGFEELSERAFSVGQTIDFNHLSPRLQDLSASVPENSSFLSAPEESALSVARAWYAAGSSPQAPWYCFEDQSGIGLGCVDIELSAFPFFLTTTTRQTPGVIVTGVDPVRPAVHRYFSELTQAALEIREVRSGWWRVSYLSKLEAGRTLAFVLLCAAFPLRLWRSIGDYKLAK
jgi:hypothetical protein